MNDEFSERFETAKFESKIIELARSAVEHEEKGEGLERFRSAYSAIEKEDHYLNVMLQPAVGSKFRKKLCGIF